MWILNSFLRDRQFISPSSETSSVWPHTTVDNRVVFLTDSYENVRLEVKRSLETLPVDIVPLDKIGHLQVTSKVAGNEGEVSLSIAVCRRFEMLSELISPYAEIHDIDTDENKCMEECDTWACVAFCSYRFDDIQHYLIGFKDQRVRWEAFTVEEDFITTKKMSPRTIRFRIHKTVFLFDVHCTMLAQRQFGPLARMVSLLFRFLPDDVSWLIASYVHAQAKSVSVKRFNHGSSTGVFNYATARLLRMANIMNREKKIQSGRIPTLLQYKLMDPEGRERVYPILKTAMRRRHQVFARSMRTKSTRSGMTY